MADSIDQAFEQAFTELGFDDTPEDGPVGNPEPDTEPEGEAPEELEEGAEDTDEEPEGEAPEDDSEGEDDEGEDEESEEDDSAVIEIAEGARIRLPDGTEVDADKAVLFQQAFTKKTTELAAERQKFEEERDAFADVQAQVEDTYEQMRSWYEERVDNPTDWVQEIALESGDATRTIAKAIYELGTAGKLDPKFVEAFGIEAGVVADTAAEANTASELAELRAWREKQEAEKQTSSQRDQLVAQYQSQWDDIKLTHGLELDGAAETEAKRELMEFAVAKKLTHDLTDAYVLMQATRQAQTPEPPKPDPVTTEKKRALSAVNPRSTSGGAAQRRKPVPKDSRAAALEAIAEFGL